MNPSLLAAVVKSPFFLLFNAFEKPTFRSPTAFNAWFGDYAPAERCASIAMSGRI
jgi:hypothetical protein